MTDMICESTGPAEWLSVLVRDDQPYAVIEYKGRRLIAELEPGSDRMREAYATAVEWRGISRGLVWLI
jgi:hypothetical protein